MSETTPRPATTVPEDALDGIQLGAGTRRRFATHPPARPRPTARKRKTRISFHLTETLAERVRDTVVALSGPPHRLTMASLAEEALQAAVKKLERDANSGKPFPKRDTNLIGGRQVGV